MTFFKEIKVGEFFAFPDEKEIFMRLEEVVAESVDTGEKIYIFDEDTPVTVIKLDN